ncbi:hypothetical protein T439DRAFT_331001 [Meredithblackwellia eburnea MCA 4105]
MLVFGGDKSSLRFFYCNNCFVLPPNSCARREAIKTGGDLPHLNFLCTTGWCLASVQSSTATYTICYKMHISPFSPKLSQACSCLRPEAEFGHTMERNPDESSESAHHDAGAHAEALDLATLAQMGLQLWEKEEREREKEKENVEAPESTDELKEALPMQYQPVALRRRGGRPGASGSEAETPTKYVSKGEGPKYNKLLKSFLEHMFHLKAIQWRREINLTVTGMYEAIGWIGTECLGLKSYFRTHDKPENGGRCGTHRPQPETFDFTWLDIEAVMVCKAAAMMAFYLGGNKLVEKSKCWNQFEEQFQAYKKFGCAFVRGRRRHVKSDKTANTWLWKDTHGILNRYTTTVSSRFPVALSEDDYQRLLIGVMANKRPQAAGPSQVMESDSQKA